MCINTKQWDETQWASTTKLQQLNNKRDKKMIWIWSETDQVIEILIYNLILNGCGCININLYFKNKNIMNVFKWYDNDTIYDVVLCLKYFMNDDNWLSRCSNNTWTDYLIFYICFGDDIMMIMIMTMMMIMNRNICL